MNPKSISEAASILGRKGGNAKVKKYGKEWLSEEGKRTAKAHKKKYGSDYYALIRQGISPSKLPPVDKPLDK